MNESGTDETTPTVLIIDDEKAIQKFLRVSLETEDYHVLGAYTAGEGLKEMALTRPDLVLLDINLPDRSGLEVLQALREWSQVPVIMLTVVEHEQEKIRCLDAGADDYITKPFATGELLARIRAALRRRPTAQTETVFKSGRLEIDFERRAVQIDHKRIKVTRIEYNILKLLAQEAGKVVTQTQIMRMIWGPANETETNLLRVHIAYLRKKIERRQETPELILTEPAVGYRLAILPVE